MIHQPLGGAEGPAKDVEIITRELLRIKDLLNRILSKHTGQPIEKIEKDTDRDFFMSAEEAKEYGIVDKVVSNKRVRAPEGAPFFCQFSFRRFTIFSALPETSLLSISSGSILYTL